MKNVDLSQEELKLIVELAQMAFKNGDLSIMGAQLILKLASQILPLIDKEVKEEVKSVENKTN